MVEKTSQRAFWRLFLVALVALAIMVVAIQKTQPLRIGLVYSVGEIDGNPFNEAAQRGVQAVDALYGITVDTVAPYKIAEIKRELERFAKDDYDLIIGIGFYATGPIVEMSYRYKDVQFALIDGDPGFFHRDNLCAATFRHQGGAFMAGALAALMSQTQKVGFIGGMRTPLISEFEQGFIAGVEEINKQPSDDVETVVAYVGEGPEGFANPVRGREIGEAMIAAGVDVIFPAAGYSGVGIMELASDLRDRQPPFYAIGVDSNQDAFAPGRILTSVIKRMERPIVEIVGEVVAGNPLPRVISGGYKEKWITLSDFAQTRDVINPERLALLLEFKQPAEDFEEQTAADRAGNE